jgi:hypothetical protein
MATKAKEPGPRRLFEPVQGLDKLTHMVRPILVDEAGRLVAVDAFREITMEKGVFDVELVDKPPPCRREVQYSPDGGRLHHRGERLVEVDARSLREPADNPPSFPAVEAAIRLQFVLEQPLAGDDVGLSRARH